MIKSRSRQLMNKVRNAEVPARTERHVRAGVTQQTMRKEQKFVP